MKNSTEYTEFTKVVDRLLTVPHSKIKSKLKTEKNAKNKKQKELK